MNSIMFNLFVKYKWRECVAVIRRINMHSGAKRIKKADWENLNELENLLIHEFQFDALIASQILKKNSYNNSTVEQLRASCKVCQKYDIKMSDTLSFSKIIYLKADNLEHKILMLQEFGATNIKDTSLSRFNVLMKMEIKKFKENMDIPADVDIVQRFFEIVFPESYQYLQLENMNKNLTFLELRMKLLLHYVKWRYEIPKDVEASTFLWRPLKYFSLRIINNSVDYLKNDKGWDIQKIQKAYYVTRYNLQNMKRIHEEIKHIGNLNIDEFTYKYPKTLKVPVEHWKVVLDYLKQNHIPEIAILNYRKILTMPLDVIEKKMSVLDNPAIKVFKSHPKFLHLLSIQHDLNERIELLHSMNFTCISLKTLISSKTRLQQINESGQSLPSLFSIETFLDNVFPKQGKALIKMLARNPNWRQVPLLQISESIKYLKQHFSLSDIFNNIHIILYNKNELEKVWNLVQTQYKNYEGHQFTSSQNLALCLYHLEIKHHFSGDGILISKANEDGTS